MSSTTPKFVVEMKGMIVLDGTSARRVSATPAAWNSKHSGRPSDDTLAAYIRSFEDSTLPGGVNEHLGVTRVGSAAVLLNGTREAVASYEPVAFAVA